MLTRIDARVAFRWDRGAPTDDLVARGELTENARSAATTSACAGPGNCCRRCRALRDCRSARTMAFACSSTARPARSTTGRSTPRMHSKSALRRPRGRQGLRPEARVLRRHPRCRGAARLAPARRQAAVRRSARCGAAGRRDRLRRRPHRRCRRRGNESELSRASPAAIAPICACRRASRNCSKRCRPPASRSCSCSRRARRWPWIGRRRTCRRSWWRGIRASAAGTAVADVLFGDVQSGRTLAGHLLQGE